MKEDEIIDFNYSNYEKFPNCCWMVDANFILDKIPEERLKFLLSLNSIQVIFFKYRNSVINQNTRDTFENYFGMMDMRIIKKLEQKSIWQNEDILEVTNFSLKTI